MKRDLKKHVEIIDQIINSECKCDPIKTSLILHYISDMDFSNKDIKEMAKIAMKGNSNGK